MIQQNVNELGTNGKTLTVTEHLMARLVCPRMADDGN